MNAVIDRGFTILEKLIGGGGLFWSYVLILTGLIAIVAGHFAGITGEFFQTTCGGIVGAGVSSFGAMMNARKTSQAIEATKVDGQ